MLRSWFSTASMLVPASKAIREVKKVIDEKFINRGLMDAGDERILLEELPEKVLSGKLRTTTYLDSEQELLMPEIGYQVLHNYADQIQNWGWICNIHSQASRSFIRNLSLIHKQPTSVTLLVLAWTDGLSIVLPSVNWVLNKQGLQELLLVAKTPLAVNNCS